jgi:hypothetical protein
MLSGVVRLIANHRSSPSSQARQKSGPFPPPALPGLRGTMTLSDSRRHRWPRQRRGRYPRARRASRDDPHHLSSMPCPHTPADRNGCSRRLLPRRPRPSPNLRRVGIRDFTFAACSGFTRVTAHWIAQPPKAAFVTRLRPAQLLGRTARQLPEQPTTLWVDPSSTGDARRLGVLRYPG